MMTAGEGNLLTFSEHLDVLRRMLFRILCVVIILACIIFIFKKATFTILLAPHEYDFCTFSAIESALGTLGMDFHFDKIDVQLISTELSAQFMTHITVSCLLAVLLAAPYILFELFMFISPALYENEKKHSTIAGIVIYLLFILGVLISYFILFPISFRFLATYSVDDSITNTITLDSYVATFTTLAFLTGIVFQLPVVAFILGKMGFIDASLLKRYRAYAFIIIMIVAAVITPPDLFTLVLVSAPLYGLYELSILVLKRQPHTEEVE